MASDIEQRILQMRFDNDQFERGIKESSNSLKNFKKDLDFKTNTKDLSFFKKMQEAVSSINFNSITKAADVITRRFSLMGNIIDNVYYRISNFVVNGLSKITNLANSLIIEPISAGRAEYDLQMGAIQTIMSNTRDKLSKAGLDEAQRLDLINDRLNQLNIYADKTIYNFAQMTRNIGTFTAAGVDLDTSVNAIKGIANLGAVSGSTNQQVSNGMYQISQAIASGTVRSIDWNSIVNAGMGGELFQKALIRTATKMGKTVETTVQNGRRKKKVKKSVADFIKDEGGFKQSLSEGWLSSDILLETLRQMSLDFEEIAKEKKITDEQAKIAIEESLKQSGKSEEEISKYFLEAEKNKLDLKEEAAKIITRDELTQDGYSEEEADDIIAIAVDAKKAATEVKTLSQLFDTLREAAGSGWTQSWQHIIGDFGEAKELLTSLSDHFGAIINDSADARNKVLLAWKNMGGRKALIDSFWNITEAIENVVSIAKEAFHEFFPPITAERLLSFTKGIENLTIKIKQLSQNSKFIQTLKSVLGGIFSTFRVIGHIIKVVALSIKNLIEYALPKDSKLLDIIGNIGEKLKAFNSELLQMGSIEKIANRVSESIKNLIDKIKNLFHPKIEKNDLETKILNTDDIIKKVTDGLSNFKEKIKDSLKNIDGGKIVSILFGGLGIGIFVKIQKFIKGLTKSKDEITNSVSGMFDGISDTIKSFKKDDGKIDAIKNISIALLAVAASLYIISKIDPSRLVASAIVLAAIMAGLIVLVQYIKKTSIFKRSGNIRTSFSLILLGTAVLLFATSLEKIGSLDTESMIKGLLGITAILFIMGTFMIYVKNADFKSFDGLGALGLADAVNKFAKSIKDIGELPTKKIIKGLIGIGAILLELAVFMKIAGTSSIGISGGLGLMVLAVSIKLFIKNIKDIANIDDESIKKGLKGLAGILIELGTFISLAKFSGIGIKSSLSILIIATSIKMFVNALKTIGDLSYESILKGLFGLGAIMIEIIAFFAIISHIKMGLKSSISMGIIALAITSFVKALSVLSEMNVEDMVKGMFGLGALLSEIIIFFAIMKHIRVGVKTAISMFMIGYAINSFVNALSVISEINIVNLAKGLVGLGVLMLELSIFLLLIKKTNISIRTTATILSVGATLVMFANAISVIGNLNTVQIIKGLIGLGLIMTELIIFLKIVNGVKITGIAKSGLIVLVLAEVMITFVVALNLLGNINTDTMLKFGVSISAMITGLAIAFKAFESISLGGIGMGAVKITLAMGLITAIFALFGFIEDKLKVSSLINKAGDLFESIGESIGRFIGGLVGGILSGVKLEKIGKSLFKFMIYFKPVLKMMKDVDKDSLDGFSKISDMLLKIGEANLMNSLASFIGGKDPIKNFANTAKELGAGIVEFAESFKGISKNKKDIDAAVQVADGINKLMTAVPWDSPDWLAKIIGKKDISKFINSMPELGISLKTFSDNIKGFSKGASKRDVDGAIEAANGLASLANSLPATGGWLQKITGVKSIENFSKEFPGFAENMKTYAKVIAGYTKVEGYKKEDTDNAIEAAKGLASFATSLPVSPSSFIGKLKGIQSIKEFSDNFESFATGMKKYAEGISGFNNEVDPDTVKLVNEAAVGIASLATALPLDDMVYMSCLNELPDLSKFTDIFGNYALGLKEYATQISTFDKIIDDKNVKSATLAAEGVANLAIAVPEEKGMLGWLIGGNKDLSKFASNMEKLGSGLSKYSESACNIAFEEKNRNNITSLINSLLDLGKSTTVDGFTQWISKAAAGGEGDINTLADQLITFGSNFKSFADNIAGAEIADVNMGYVDSIIKKIEGISTSAENNTLNSEKLLEISSALGMSFMDELVNVIRDGSSKLKSQIDTLLIECKDSIKSKQTSWYAAGTFLGAGLAKGIYSMRNVVLNRAWAIASAALSIISKVWVVRSPSKAGIKLGGYLDKGLAIGIESYASKVTDASENMAQGALDSAKTMLSGANGSIFDDIDPNPTIRPVMDLNNIRAGVGMINGMFDNNEQTVGTLFGVDSFNAGVNGLKFDNDGRISSGMSNKDIVDKLQDLNDKFNNLSESVGNMKLVLDTGVLVGETTAMIDDRLGTLAMRRGRGN
ncbi:MAG: tape measure protein [Eubacteriales bacterium]|nr:tape measure protein [Eubacteriales bacterium]